VDAFLTADRTTSDLEIKNKVADTPFYCNRTMNFNWRMENCSFITNWNIFLARTEITGWKRLYNEEIDNLCLGLRNERVCDERQGT
jgi:hypothetical protein